MSCIVIEGACSHGVSHSMGGKPHRQTIDKSYHPPQGPSCKMSPKALTEGHTHARPHIHTRACTCTTQYSTARCSNALPGLCAALNGGCQRSLGCGTLSSSCLPFPRSVHAIFQSNRLVTAPCLRGGGGHDVIMPHACRERVTRAAPGSKTRVVQSGNERPSFSKWRGRAHVP